MSTRISLTRGAKRKVEGVIPTSSTSTSSSTPVKARRKVEKKSTIPADTSASIPASAASRSSPKPSTADDSLPYTPSLLPPTLKFSLPSAIEHLSNHDPRFKLMFSTIPCRPFHEPIEAVDPYRTLVVTIIGQQVSWMAAKAITRRFRAHFGFEEDDQSFPTPMQVAKAEVIKLREVGLSFRKAEYIICLAEHFVDGRLSTELLSEGSDEEIAKALIAVRGIGQWTVDMFMIFSLRRPDVLPVGDLGVQKGLLRWALAAHGALPPTKSKTNEQTRKKYGLAVDEKGSGELDTRILTPPPEGDQPVPQTPQIGSLVTAHAPPTPVTPSSHDKIVQVPNNSLPPDMSDNRLLQPPDASFDAHRCAPLPEGMTIEGLKSRLAGKKAKGGVYLTPKEMETLTGGWRPYRSLGVYYTWPMGEDF
ncbi:DNA glycosylase [Kockovaella imperatae]|uniref:DNA glycosylase n=1 Tax=Kockovaella imperatae TaxID=4999 RepID=A0A1Y1UDZ2_9TREE|nr:DNA glycosylase [Kockovaella imperatae]ORX35757.1 DNA glycosylase [Kockovaella imperatae]